MSSVVGAANKGVLSRRKQAKCEGKRGSHQFRGSPSHRGAGMQQGMELCP